MGMAENRVIFAKEYWLCTWFIFKEFFDSCQPEQYEYGKQYEYSNRWEEKN